MKTEKLELKHLAGYLPYQLKAITIIDAREDFLNLEIDNYYIFDKGNIWTYCGYADSDLCIPLGEGEFNGFILRNKNSYADIQNFVKPILRPLSDLTKEIEVNGEKFMPMERLQEFLNFDDDLEITDCLQILLHNLDTSSYYFPPNFFLILYGKLYEWHFDIHGLIEKGLAIDINTLEK